MTRMPDRVVARDEGRDVQPEGREPNGRERTGHRREYDIRQPRRSFEERVEGMVRDIGAFRVVALKDLIARHFDGHPFVARRGLARAEREGWVEKRTARGPQGGAFTVVVATAVGAARAEALWREAGRPGQRAFSGAVRPAELAHDVALYRAVGAVQARVEAAGGRVVRVRIDAELKGLLASCSKRRAAEREAADEERRRVAADLGLPVEDGRVLVPDAQVEYADAAGRTGRCNVDVASEHYRGRSIRAKAKAGFALYASSRRAAAAVRRALGGGSDGRRGGGALRQEHEVIEL